jgi:hypothetical protein
MMMMMMMMKEADNMIINDYSRHGGR